MKPDTAKRGHIASGGPLIHIQSDAGQRNKSVSVRRHRVLEKLRDMPVPVLGWGKEK